MAGRLVQELNICTVAHLAEKQYVIIASDEALRSIDFQRSQILFRTVVIECTLLVLRVYSANI